MSSLGLNLFLAIIAALALLMIGRVLARLCQIRGLLGVAIAPALTLAVAGVGAVVSGLLGAGWGFGAMAASAIVAFLIAAALTRLTQTKYREPLVIWAQPAGAIAARPHRLWHGVMVLLAVLPYLDGMRGGMYLQRWDMLFHASALQHISHTGQASSLTLGSLAHGDGQAAFYPGAWHAYAALLPGPVISQLTAAMLVLCAVSWVLGIGALTQTLTDSVPVLRIATLGAAVIVASPLSLAIGWGHIPNAVGFAAMPAVVALGIRIIQEFRKDLIQITPALAGLALAGVGLALCHPNAALSVLALLLIPGFLTLWHRLRPHGRPVAFAAVTVCALIVIAATQLLARSPLGLTVSDFGGHEVLGAWHGFGQVVSGLYELWVNAATSVFTVGAAVGAFFAARRKNYVPAGMIAVGWALYIDAAAGSPVGLASFWYSSPARLSVVVAAIALPLAAMGYHEIWQRWIIPHLAKVHGGPRVVLLPIGLVLIVGLIGHSWGYRHTNTARVADLESTTYPRFISGDEWHMIASLERDLPEPGIILGNPFSGAASAYGLTGVDVVFPVANQILTPEMSQILSAADDGDLLAACDQLQELNVRYLYVDSEPYQHDERYRPLDFATPDGAELIAEGDTAQVYLLPEC